MKKKLLHCAALAILFTCLSCAVKRPVLLEEVPLAFPGAEGFGKFTTGGRGGKVFVVTHLNDAGPGSFRVAASAKMPRIIVFAVSGTIHLESELGINGDVTIAGQTAPGDGICLADYPVTLKGNNIIVRFLRFRMGDRYQDKGMTEGAGSDDAFGGGRRNHVIVDHCSMSWSTDEACSFYAGDSTTLQWNIIAEPLNYSYHFEKGDKDFEKHGYGGIWGGRHASFHHNLFAHCASRTPRFDGIRNIEAELADYRNNVIYNWGNNNVYAGEGGNYNIVNNYYKAGPSTNKNVQFRVANPYKTAGIPFGKWFISGNYVFGSAEVSADNWKGVTMNNGNEADKANARSNRAFLHVAIQEESAQAASKAVLGHAGASLPARDTLDARIVMDVINGTGRLIDVQGGYPHGTPYAITRQAWPTLKSAPPLKDMDGDGMPDAWEEKNGLNRNDPEDAKALKLHKYYTNIEVYLNSLVNFK